MNNNLKNILYIGVNSSTTFIQRTIKEIKKHKDFNYYILVDDYNHLNIISDDIRYIKKISSLKDFLSSGTFFNFIKILLSINSLIKLKKAFQSMEYSSSIDKIKIIFKNLNLFCIDIQIVHFQWFNHYKDYDWYININKIKTIGNVRGSMLTVAPFKNQKDFISNQNIFNKLDRIHFVSASIKEYAFLNYDMDENRSFVHYNGIDTDFFKPKINVESKKITLTMNGGFEWRKNFSFAFYIIKQLISINRDKEIFIIVIGYGEDIWKLNFFIERLMLSKNIKLLGRLNEDQVLEELQKTDIFISTSHAEGLSNSVMEAASVGIPCVVLNCEGMDELIINGETGFIINTNEITTFLDKLNQLINNLELRLKMGHQARLHILEKFKISDQIHELLTSYKTISSK
tara:strand:+ start:4041 stop:5243 length:1203 start_codon:yes stop_codon:yes gene_type:complete